MYSDIGLMIVRQQASSRLQQRKDNNAAKLLKLLVFSDLSLQATGPQLGTFLAGVISVVGGITVAFLGSWKLTLVMLAFMPMLFFGGMIANRFVTDLTKTDTGSISSAGQVSNI